MKRVGVVSTAVLSLALGMVVPAFAQQEQHEQEEQKAKPEEKKAQPEKIAKQEEKSSARQEKNTEAAEKNTQEKDRSARQVEKNAPQQRAQQERPQQHTQHASARIPDERFKANFGREHRFRVSQADYRRGHRFQYGGYWFGIVDPWPSNWLYTEDVYVVEINGVYYLCNPMYPGVNLVLDVTL